MIVRSQLRKLLAFLLKLTMDYNSALHGKQRTPETYMQMILPHVCSAAPIQTVLPSPQCPAR